MSAVSEIGVTHLCCRSTASGFGCMNYYCQVIASRLEETGLNPVALIAGNTKHISVSFPLQRGQGVCEGHVSLYTCAAMFTTKEIVQCVFFALPEEKKKSYFRNLVNFPTDQTATDGSTKQHELEARSNVVFLKSPSCSTRDTSIHLPSHTRENSHLHLYIQMQKCRQAPE